MAINKNFVVKNGLEVNERLILANADTNRVGIGTTVPEYDLHVFGGIGATHSYVTGVSTVGNEFRVGAGGSVFTVIAGPTGFGQSVGVGTADPSYLLEVRSPVSTGQTALYVYGDMRVTGDINLDDITLDDASIQDLTVTAALNVLGLSTFVGYVNINDTFNVVGITTLGAYVDINDSVDISDNLNVVGLTTLGNVVDINSTVDISDTLNVGSATTLGGYVDINADTDISGTLNVVGLTTLGNVVDINSTVDISDTLNVGGATTLGGYVDINADTDISGTLNVGGATTLGGYVDINNSVDISEHLNVVGVSTLATVDINDGDIEVSNVDTTDLYVSGISTLGTVEVNSGVITATTGIVTYYGDGQFLQNVIRGVGIASTNPSNTYEVVGFGATIITFAGPGISTSTPITVSAGIATITFEGGGGGATIGVGTDPTEAGFFTPASGNLWYNTNLGRLFIYYEDIDSSQWVDAAPFNVGIVTSLITAITLAPQTASNPSLSFIGDSNTGLFSPSIGQQTFVSTGSSVLNINPAGIVVTGIATAQDFDSLSDANLKENITTVDNALDITDQLRGVRFEWKKDHKPSYGVIAQELEQILPELVSNGDPKTVNYNGIIGVLIEAIKELRAEVEELKGSK